MTNPILNALNGSRNGNLLGRLAEIKQVINGQPIDAVYNRLLQTNPQFQQFVKQNQGKSIEQLACEFGVDPNMLQNVLR